jgi:hypothetical protein
MEKLAVAVSEIMKNKTNSAPETIKHILKVQNFIHKVTSLLVQRGIDHDASKLQNPEKREFDEFTSKLAGLTYGSEEYKQCLKDIKPALDHHYSNNRHHPEHFGDGINGMNLIDIIEMLCDWKAATLRHNNGSMKESLEINRKRFGMSDQMYDVLKNTIVFLGWDDK